jgi:hypothetical protein
LRVLSLCEAIDLENCGCPGPFMRPAPNCDVADAQASQAIVVDPLVVTDATLAPSDLRPPMASGPGAVCFDVLRPSGALSMAYEGR